MFRTPTMLAFAASALIATTAQAQTWTPTAALPQGTVGALAQNGTSTLAAMFYGSMHFSPNYGASWSAVGPAGAQVVTLHNANGTFYAGLNGVGSTLPGMIYRSTNGTVWTQSLANAASLGRILALASGSTGSDPYVLAGTNKGVMRLAVNTNTWSAANTGLPVVGGNAKQVISLAAMGTRVYAGVLGNGVYQSNDGGLTWVSIGLPGKTIHSLLITAVNGTTFLAGGVSGPEGVWKKVGNGPFAVLNTGILPNPNMGARDILALHLRGGTVFAGQLRANVVSQMPTNGTIWSAANAGLPPPNFGFVARAFSSNGCAMFVGTDIGVRKWVHTPGNC